MISPQPPYFPLLCLPLCLVAIAAAADGRMDSDLDLVLRAQERRIEIIERVSPSVVCIFDSNEQGGGSGVIIDPDGYGLTNYHVVAGMLRTRKGLGGLPDHQLYPLEVLGIDPTGDVAMFRLTGREVFPYVELGDSDQVRVGDIAYVLGNAFMLSEDYTPTVTVRLVSGVHRYQWGVGNNLVYSDCIQTDAAVNPGNSGGPLFNKRGEVIGINGRISINTRGRYNVGLGYAISSNQIKRFIPALRAGLLARHGTLQAKVEFYEGVGTVFTSVTPGQAADKAGLIAGDKLLSFDGLSIVSRNHYASLLGTYPANWPVTLQLERNGQRKEIVVRLDPIEPKLRHPFTVTRRINQREVQRVLGRFAEIVRGDRTSPHPTEWKWTVDRRYRPASDGTVKPPQRFEVSQAAGQPARMRRIYEDGSHGAIIEYDARSAVRHTSRAGESFVLAPDDAMILGALHLIQDKLLTPPEEETLADVVHAGSAGFRRAQESRLLEVIAWPVGDEKVVRFGFDTDTGRLMRAVVRDRAAGTEATLIFGDYRDIGGLLFPCTLEVEASGYAYQDTLGNWELSP